MRPTGTKDSALVVAAQAGDRRALDDLVTTYLPMVYTIVRRALSGDSEVDDVVQETMLRALRELGTLRVPESFKAWLAAITVRQVSTHLHRQQRATARSVALEEVIGEPDLGADVENLATLRVDLTGQRRQLVRASRWLDPDDRALLSLWWLEVAGQLTRTELADALGVSIAHAGVRVQRMHAELDLARTLVAALEAHPRCTGLSAVIATWTGQPSPLWRKRIARHTRSCANCTRAAGEMVVADRLLVGYALLSVPLALTAGLLGKIALGAVAGTAATVTAAGTGVAAATGGVGAKAGVLSSLLQAGAAHPIAATLLAGAVVAGATVTATNWPSPAAPPPVTISAPTSAPPLSEFTARSPAAGKPSPAPARTLAAGPASLESVNLAGTFVATVDSYGVLIPTGSGSSSQLRQAATFQVVPGLADPACFSFRLPDGQYLRHSSWRLRVYPADSSQLFLGDATFCVRAGSVPGSISLESSNYPGWYLRHRGTELWVDHSDGTAGFRADSSFRVRAPL